MMICGDCNVLEHLPKFLPCYLCIYDGVAALLTSGWNGIDAWSVWFSGSGGTLNYLGSIAFGVLTFVCGCVAVSNDPRGAYIC